MSMSYVRRFYRVPAGRGMRVVYNGDRDGTPRAGTITSADGAYLRIRLDGESSPGKFHPTWKITYLTPAQVPAPGSSRREAAEVFAEDLPGLIAYLQTTEDRHWCTEVVRAPDGSSNCFFGHLFAFAAAAAGPVERTEAEAFASAVWAVFEDRWSTTYVIYPVNDGTYPGYDQPTPKARVIAYLQALAAGAEEITSKSMERHARMSEKEPTDA